MRWRYPLLALMLAPVAAFVADAASVHVYEKANYDGTVETLSDTLLSTGQDYKTQNPPQLGGYIFTHWATSATAGFLERDVFGRAWDEAPYTLYGTTTLTANYLLGSEDADNDGVADGYEIYWYGNLAKDASSDTDNDGMTFAEELTAGTNPLFLDRGFAGVQSGCSAIVLYNPTSCHRWTFRSEPEGSLVETESGYSQPGDEVSTPMLDRHADFFAYWMCDGVATRDALGRAVDSVTFKMPDADVEYVAVEEIDDFRRESLYWYGEIKDRASDTDGDGMTLSEEINAGTNPLLANRSFIGVQTGRSACVIYSPSECYAYTFRSEPEGELFETVTGYANAGDTLTTPTMSRLDDCFSVWYLDGVRQSDNFGRALDAIAFTMPSHDVEVVAYSEVDNDKREVAYWYGVGMFANVEAAMASDTDCDGMTLAEEIAACTNPHFAERSLMGVVSGTSKMVEVGGVNPPPMVFVVAFDANGGLIDGCATIHSVEVEESAQIMELPTPERLGYDFKGWFTDKDSGTQIFGTTTATADVTYYAHWAINQYTVVFDANGGEGGWSRSMNYGETIVAPTVTRTDHTFVGWLPDVPATVPASNVTCTAQWQESSYFVSINEDQTLTITWVAIASVGDLVIPSTINGKPVTRIGSHAFRYCRELKTVEIPDTVTEIDKNAFSGCESLEKITVAKGNPNYKFSGGLLLTKDGSKIVCVPEGRDYIFIPESVTEISWMERYALKRCSKLEINTDRYGIESIDGWIIGVVDEDVLPSHLELNGYRGIASDVFHEIDSLKSVTIGEGMRSIGECAFQECENLESITIPASVLRIGEEAFKRCFSLKKISLAQGNMAYRYENNLLSTLDGKELIAISRNAKNAVIPEGVVLIPDCFFAGCAQLTNVTIPASVEWIGEGAFAYWDDDEDYGNVCLNCPALKTIEVAEGNRFFRSEGGMLLHREDQGWMLVAVPQVIADIIIPEGVTSIEWSAFGGSAKLTAITLPESLCDDDWIDAWTDEDFDDIIPPNVVSFTVQPGNPVFSAQNGLLLSCDGRTLRCIPRGLARVAIPASVIDIEEDVLHAISGKVKAFSVDNGNQAYYSSSGMLFALDGELVAVPGSLKNQRTVTIPAGTKRIGDSVFEGFSKLTSITIPEGVEEIGEWAFYDCEALSKVTFPMSLKIIRGYAFRCCPIKNISIPVGVEEIDEYAFDFYAMSHLCDSTSIPGFILFDGWLVGLSDSFKYDYANPEEYLNDALQSSRIKGIAGNAFNGTRTILHHISLPECVKRITSGQFSGCFNLESVDMPSGVKSIGYGAFYNTKLSNITIPESVICVEERVFSDNAVNHEFLPGIGIVDGWVVKNDGIVDWLLKDETYDGELIFSGDMGIRGIADCTFRSGLQGVNSLVIGEGVRSIGSYAFENCSDLTNVCLALTVEYIGKHAFRNCGNLQTVYLPDSIRGKVPASAFPENAQLFYCREDGTVWKDSYTIQAGVAPDIGGVISAFAPADGWKLAVSGLPAGIKFDAKKGVLTGVATKEGTYTVTFTATRGSGKNQEKQVATTTFKVVFPALALEVASWDDDSATGTVTGAGRYPFGKKLTLKATPAKGCVFIGWYNGETLISQSVSYSYTTTDADVTLTARFATLTEDLNSIGLSLGGVDVLPEGNPLWECRCGVPVVWPIDSSALSATTVKVAGLPSGLKLVQDKITKAYSITGVPTAASKTDAKSGEVIPSKAKITVTTAGKSSKTFPLDIEVLPLPEWAYGTFAGDVSDGGSVSLTIGASGKISGKIMANGKTWTVSASSYAEYDKDGDSFIAAIVCKSGRETLESEFSLTGRIVDSIMVGVIDGAAGDDAFGVWRSWQNLWKRSDTKTSMPVFKKNIVVDVEGGLKFTFKKDGVVSYAGKVYGQNVSGSSQLILTDEGYQFVVYNPQKSSFAGLYQVITVVLNTNDQNTVDSVLVK